MSKIRTLGSLGAAALLLAACSSGGDATPTASSTAPAPATSSAAPTSAAPTSAEPSPTGPTETIFASLCDEATPEQVALIKGALKPEFRVSQLVDVRTDDDGKHAILGFVEGPGLSVLAVWTGTGLDLQGLAAADEFAVESSTAPTATADTEFQQLIDATPNCYRLLFAPDS